MTMREDDGLRPGDRSYGAMLLLGFAIPVAMGWIAAGWVVGVGVLLVALVIIAFFMITA